MSTQFVGDLMPMSSPHHVPVPTVFIVDDDISVREALELLVRHEGFEAKSFVSADAFLAHEHELGPCCLLLDIALPGLTGLELQKTLAIERPAMPIVFITGREDPPTIVKAMKAGAVEFLTKPFNDDALREAVRSALERSVDLVRHERFRITVRQRYDELTRREREVLALIVEGFLNREIAVELGISEITVKAHRGQVMRKMGADSLANLIQMTGQVRL
jgi:FixJ family two-component response regulator